MEIVKLPSIDSYWNVKDPFLMNYLPKKISKNYYKLLSSALHIPEEDNENVQEKTEDNINATHKIDWILDVMKEKFKKFYEIGNKVTIDEAMVPS